MSTRSSIFCDFGMHIYHEWADEGFVYVNPLEGDPVKLCSLEDWYKFVKFIKESAVDCNGYNILNGNADFLTGPKPE